MFQHLAFVLAAFVVSALMPLPGLGRELPPEMKYNVQLFEHSNFNKKGGGRVAVLYMGTSNVTSYKKDGTLKKLQDKVSSLIWNLPPGCKLKLFEHVDYKGKVLELTGSGRSEGLKGFNDKISSHQWVNKASCDKYKPKPPAGGSTDRNPLPGGGASDPGDCLGRCQVIRMWTGG